VEKIEKMLAEGMDKEIMTKESVKEMREVCDKMFGEMSDALKQLPE